MSYVLLWNVHSLYCFSGFGTDALSSCIILLCIIVTWWSGPGGIKALSERPASFLQCFDTVGLVI